MLFLLLIAGFGPAQAQVTNYYWFGYSPGGNTTWYPAVGGWSTQSPGDSNSAATLALASRGATLRCTSWSFAYNDPRAGNVPAPVVSPYGSQHGTLRTFPLAFTGCTNSGSPYPDVYLAPSNAIAQLVCESGYDALAAGTGVIFCTPSLANSQAIQAEGGISTMPSLESDYDCAICRGRGLVGDPVDITSGNVFETEMDYAGAGGYRLEFTRFYNSSKYPAGSGYMGNGWRHSYSYQLITKAGNFVYRVAPDGRTSAFTFQAGQYVAPAGERGGLAPVLSNGNTVGWKYTAPNGDVETYGVAGVLTGIQRKRGGALALTYSDGIRLSAVSDGLGRTLTLNYTGGYLSSVTGPGGIAVATLTYDSYRALSAVSYGDGTARHYSYEQRTQRLRSFRFRAELD